MTAQTSVIVNADIAQFQQKMADAARQMQQFGANAGKGFDGVNMALSRTTENASKLTVSSKQVAAAFRMLPAQMSDVAVQLAGGQSPFMVMLQQGSQVKDSFGGLRNMAIALTSAITPVGTAMTLAAAAAGGLVYAMVSGSEQTKEFSKSIALSGGAVGKSVDQLRQLSVEVGKSVGSQSLAAQALAELARGGQVAGEGLARYAAMAVEMQQKVGVPIAETAKNLAALGEEPVAASRKLNESLRYLEPAVYDMIRALADQGKEAEAAAAAQNAYSTAMSGRIKEVETNLGSLERAWSGVKAMAGATWDAMLGVGRSQTLQQQLEEQEKALEALRNRPPLAFVNGKEIVDRSGIKEAEQRIDDLRKRIAQQAADAQAEGARATVSKAYVAARDDIDRMMLSLDKTAQKQKEVNDLTKKFLDLHKGNPDSPLLKGVKVDDSAGAVSGGKYDELRKQINDRYMDKSAINAALSTAKAAAEREIDGIREALRSLTDAYAGSERTIEALRSAGMIDEERYYTAKRDLLSADARAQADAINQQIAVLQQLGAARKLSGADAENNLRRINELQEQSARVQSKAAVDMSASVITQTGAVDKLRKSMELLSAEARKAAEDMLETFKVANQRNLDALDLGPMARDYVGGQNQIDDRYSQERIKIQRQMAMAVNDEQRAALGEQLAINADFHIRALIEWDRYFTRVREKQSDMGAGFKGGMNDWVDAAKDMNGQIRAATVQGLNGLADAFAQFVTTGKMSFKDFADNVVQQLARIVVQQAIIKGMSAMGFTMSAKGNAFDGAGIVPFANGGIVDKPTLFAYGGGVNRRLGVMGEAGPEAILPLTRGRDGKMGVQASGGGGGVTIQQNITVQSGVNKAEMLNAMRIAKNEAVYEVMAAQDRGFR